jgi:hypothetical protein
MGGGRVQSAELLSRPTERVSTAACRNMAAGSSWCQTYKAWVRQRNRLRSVVCRKTIDHGSSGFVGNIVPHVQLKSPPHQNRPQL